MNKVIVLALLVVAAATLGAQERGSFFTSELGFSLVPPTVDLAEGQTVQVGIFFLPISNGFSANVNIQIQPYEGTLEDYDQLSQEQFRQYNLTLIDHEATAEGLRYEYSGLMQGKTLHWYSLAKQRGNRVFLITATGQESDWAQQSEALRRSVDSFAFPANL